MKIGIDFDNTIVCYDDVFAKVAKIEGFLPNDFFGDKSQVKSAIKKQKNGEALWQKLQGQVYGKFILEAKVFDGLFEFLIFAKKQKAEIFIVSHKTIFGHYDEAKINLHDAAILFVKEKKLDEFIHLKDVFFMETREQKITKVNELKLDCFIDDLEEVLEDKNFPQIKKILFNPKNNCWAKIKEQIFDN